MQHFVSAFDGMTEWYDRYMYIDKQKQKKIENRNEFPSKLNDFCGTFEDIREQTRGVRSLSKVMTPRAVKVRACCFLLGKHFIRMEQH